MKIVLCRHGRTDWNNQRRYQGWQGTPLNETGFEHAKLVSEALKDENFEYTFCSPLKRCLQTAKEIMKLQKCKLEIKEGLKEINYGDFAGHTPSNIQKKMPGMWEKRKSSFQSKYDFKHPNGESFREIDENRVKPMLEEFKEKYYSRKILLVTHQGVGRLILGNLMGFSEAEKMDLSIPNDCIYYLNYRPNKTTIRHYFAETGKSEDGFLRREDEP